jgi:hypothetical protein
MDLYLLNLCIGQGQEIQMPYKKLKMGYPRRTVAGVPDGDTIKFRNS